MHVYEFESHHMNTFIFPFRYYQSLLIPCLSPKYLGSMGVLGFDSCTRVYVVPLDKTKASNKTNPFVMMC